MEEQLKEIEGLLETTTHPADDDEPKAFRSVKKYVKLALPHVALVAVVCLYAIIGAYIFYRLESPNEDRLKAIGRQSITEMRSNLIREISLDTSNGGVEWKKHVEQELMQYSDKLYTAFKEQYVRYSDVRSAVFSEPKDEHERKKRARGKSRVEHGEKMWTASSALFFAATTMATIGYGNIVPSTSSGRIACVIFALFGAPLAIITIGDLGKFLSECTIWLYKHMRKLGVQIQLLLRRLRGHEVTMGDIESANRRKSSSDGSLDWEDLVIDKTEVPVMMVFTILLLYIAFGGILFSILEDWSYMDAFYYSFISLTTIGFGDIVPENHDYIVIMLIYLGVGLSVTTMCIDLVGIQYIQKIHYFGRKFRGTDLLHLLKRKRMIERRLAMGQGEDLLRIYVHQIEKEMEHEKRVQQKQMRQPTPEKEKEEPSEMKEHSISNSMLRIDDSLSAFNVRFYDTWDEETIDAPLIHSTHAFNPSIWSGSSARCSSAFAKFHRERGGSWAESGPSITPINSPLSTEPSVHVRQNYWENWQSPRSSVESFEHRSLYSPTFDYAQLASNAKTQYRRSASCPPMETIPCSPIGLACMQDWDSYIRMLEESSKPYEGEIVPNYAEVESDEESRACSPMPIAHQLFSDAHPTVSSFEYQETPQHKPHFAPFVFFSPKPLVHEFDAAIPTKQDADETIQRVNLDSMEKTISSPVNVESEPEEEPIGIDVSEHNEPMPQKSADIDLGAFELVDSGLTPQALLAKDEPVIFHQSLPVHSVHHDTVQTEAALTNLMSAPSSMLTDAIPPIMVEDNYCFVVDGERVRMGDILGDDQWWRHTSRPTKYFYSEDLRQFHRVNCITAKGKVITAKLASGVSAMLSHHPVAGHSSMTNTPRSSISGGTFHSTPSRSVNHDASKVPLNNVYKVIRFYSFWKTCTSFHRIVTMIDKVVDTPSTTTPEGNQFKKRLFVQYLWRNAKPVEKARVQKEFDPRRQRLLRFVTDPAARKRFQRMS